MEKWIQRARRVKGGPETRAVAAKSKGRKESRRENLHRSSRLYGGVLTMRGVNSVEATERMRLAC
jgi:hypothetical protein